MISKTQPYRLESPIFRWLFLVFLSAGLANGSFRFESVKPVYRVENVLSVRKNLADAKKTIRFSPFRKTGCKPQTLRSQNIRLAFLAWVAETRCTISFVRYPAANHFLSYHTAVNQIRRILTSPDDSPFPA